MEGALPCWSDKGRSGRLLDSRDAPAAAEKEKRFGSGMSRQWLIVGLQCREKIVGGGECAVGCPNGNATCDASYRRLRTAREILGEDADELELVWIGKRVDCGK